MSQSTDILCHLESGRSITALEALHLYGCLRLAARIAELKRSGYPIRAEEESELRCDACGDTFIRPTGEELVICSCGNTHDISTVKRWARYSLVRYEQLELAL